jgi:AcrR family transcriptional regulator
MVTQDSPDNTKERITDYSRTRFLDDGFARVSVDEICSALGMSKKTFYKYFNSKEDLVHAIVDRMLAEAGAKVEAILAMHAPFPAKLDALVRTVGGIFRSISKHLIRDLQVHIPDTWARIQTFRREKIFVLWTRIIEEGKNTGYVRPEVNTRVFMLALLSTVEAIITPATLMNESFSSDEALETILTIFMKGILTDVAASEFHGIPHNS